MPYHKRSRSLTSVTEHEEGYSPPAGGHLSVFRAGVFPISQKSETFWRRLSTGLVYTRRLFTSVSGRNHHYSPVLIVEPPIRAREHYPLVWYVLNTNIPASSPGLYALMNDS